MPTAGTESSGGGGDRYCPNCGEQAEDGADFCGHCGAELSDAAGPESRGDEAAAAMPASPWYPYIFVGVALLTGGLFAAAATPAEPGKTPEPVALAFTVTAAGWALLVVAMYRDTAHVARRGGWSPRQWLWTLGSIPGVLNYAVVAVYVRRRAKRTGRPWRPQNPFLPSAGSTDSASIAGVEVSRSRIALAAVVFAAYNWAMGVVATDLGTVAVSLVSLWEVTGVAVAGAEPTYVRTGYSPVGAVVSAAGAYAAAAVAITKLQRR